MKRMKKALATLAVMAMTANMFPTNAFATTPNRFAGVDRYQTASLIADEVGSPNKVAILTAGMDSNLVDALAAAPFASSQKAPILLTGGTELNEFTQAELTRLAVNKVYITSGSRVIAKPVTDKLTSLGINFEFVGGADRYETALNIAKKLSAPTGVIVAGANDANLVDSLSASSIAAQNNMAIVLTDKNGMTASSQTYVKNLNVPIYVIGGNGVVSDSVVTSLKATRVSGSDRYATNVAVLNQFKAKVNFETAYVASGNDTHLVDALTGAMLAAKSNSAIILSDGTTIPSATADFIKTAGIKNVVAFGGTGTVPENIRTGIVSPIPVVTPPVVIPPVSTGGGYTITPNQNQIAPTEILTGIAPTSVLSDGKITGTTTAMEYKLSTDSTYITVAGAEVTGLGAGTYDVRYTAKTGFNAGATTSVTVPAYVAPVVTLNSIAITTPATKLIYSMGDILDISGLVVTGTYSDTSTQVETILPTDVSGFNSATPVIDQLLTITVGGKTATYTITVNDTTAPAITLLGNTTENVANGATYTDAGVIATDNVDPSVTVTSVITNASGAMLASIDTSVAGTYTVTYNATDTAGNTATPVTRTVVVAAPAPIISNVSVSSNNADNTKAMNGDTITLTFTSNEPVTKLSNFKINGSNPNTFTSVGNNYTATHLVDSGDTTGSAITFQINVQNVAGIYSQTIETTSNNSSVTIIPEYARISGVNISSSNTTSSAIATIGDTITLTFTSDEQVTKLSNFNINGSNPNTFVETTNSNGTYTYTTTHLVDSGDLITNVPSTFQINVKNAAGINSPTVEQTTDGSSVTIN